MSPVDELWLERCDVDTPSDELFVLIHGFAATAYTWRHWTPALQRRGALLTVEMKGFGRASKARPGRFDPGYQAELVAAAIQREPAGRITVVGHSLGGGVALLTALELLGRGDDRVSRLVVVAGAAYPQRLPPFVHLARRPKLSGSVLRCVGPERIVRWVIRSIVHDPETVDDAQVAAYAAPLRTRDGVAAMFEAARQIVPADLPAVTDRYATIEAPTLLLWGAHDRVVPLATGKKLAKALPRAELEVLDACGHIPQEELPERSRAVLERFLDRTDEERDPRSSAG